MGDVINTYIKQMMTLKKTKQNIHLIQIQINSYSVRTFLYIRIYKNISALYGLKINILSTQLFTLIYIHIEIWNCCCDWNTKV